MTLWRFLAFASILASRGADGEVTLTLSGPAKANAGQSVTLSLTVNGNPDCGCSGVQWKISLPPEWGIGGLIGASGIAAQKSLASSADGLLKLNVGTSNANIIPNGVAATFVVAIPFSASGNVSLALSGMLAVSPSGGSLAVASGPPYSLTVLPRYDLNGDGKFDAGDVQFLVNVLLAGGLP